MFEENMQAWLPEVRRSESEVQCGGGTEKEKERYRGRKRDGEREGENNKGTEAKENRGYGEWGRRKNWSYEEDSRAEALEGMLAGQQEIIERLGDIAEEQQGIQLEMEVWM